MSLESLLKTRADAHALRDQCAAALVQAAEHLAFSTDSDAGAALAAVAADKAIHELLKEKGVHYTAAADGTVVFYQASDAEPGWFSYHPVPGTDPAAEPEQIPA